jgi:5-methylcytosine-specific restriction endonuclease McrA
MKPCKKCGSIERYTSGACKHCARANASRYQREHKESVLPRKLAWARQKRAEDPVAAREKDRLARSRYKEQRRQYNRDYYNSHRDYWQRWAKERHPQNRIAFNKWKAAHPDTYRAAMKRWRKNNPALVAEQIRRRKAKRQGAQGTHSYQQAQWRRQVYGSVCWICKREPGVHLDHVIALCNGGSDWPANLRPACAQCNGAKGAWESTGKKTPGEIMSWVSAHV